MRADGADELTDGAYSGGRLRPVEAPSAVSPLRALAGAGLAVAGVVLGIGALLSVTGDDPGSPTVDDSALSAQAPVQAGPAADPADDLPAVASPTPRATLRATSRPTPSATRVPTPAARATTTRPAPAAPAPAAPASVPRATRTAAARPAVAVLNNSTRSGLADRAAARFRRNGWPVALTGNYRGKLRATTVYYEPGQRAAAERFARAFRGIARVLPRSSNIPGPRGLVVVVTRDFPA